jgi:GMP synthase-like glutamine amidotransferase
VGAPGILRVDVSEVIMKKIAVVCCADKLPGSLMETFGSDGQHWDKLMPDIDGFVAAARGYDGYVISGSPKSVNDDRATPMVRNVLALINDVYTSSSAPILGICFGSQAIAAAFGGHVGRNPGGHFRLGVDELIWAGRMDRASSPETLRPSTLIQSHGECVLELPSDSKLLASSSTTPHEIFLVSNRFLGVQGHPEVDNTDLQETFMPYHRKLFDAAQWQIVETESKRPIEPGAVIELGRRLLADGYL